MNVDAQQRLEGVLDQEIEAVRLLAANLSIERAALTGSSADDVTAVAAHKIELFGMIEKLENQRRALCDAASISLPNIRKAMTPDIAGVSPPVADRWRALLELIAGCRIANEVNGYIINARRGQLGQLMEILRGGAAVTYDPLGRTHSKSLRALARA